MSAYIVGRAHINALLRVGLDGPSDNPGRMQAYGPYWHMADEARHLTYETVDGVGQMLTDANVRSVRDRYPDDTDDTLPGSGDWIEPYTYPTFGEVRQLTAVEALKALDGYE